MEWETPMLDSNTIFLDNMFLIETFSFLPG